MMQKLEPILPRYTSFRSNLPNHPIQKSKIFSVILLIVAFLAIVTHLLTSFAIPSLSSEFAHTIAAATSSHAESCTSNVGDSICCALFMEAEPCVEECRREFVDRETREMKLGFGDCEGRCLKTYFAEGCSGGERVPASESASDDIKAGS